MHQDVEPTGAVALVDAQRLEVGHRANLRTLDALLKALPQAMTSGNGADLSTAALAAQRLASTAARRATAYGAHTDPTA